MPDTCGIQNSAMKVTRDLPDQLILDHTPWLFSVLFGGMTLIFVGIGAAVTLSGELFGLMFLIIGGGVGSVVFFMIARRVQLVLDRPGNTATLRKRTLIGYSETVHALSDLQKAILEEQRSSKGGATFRPSLVLSGMSAGIHPIIKIYSNASGSHLAVDTINRWLDQNTREDG